MPNRNTNLALYLAKIEVTEGTDPVPTSLLNAIELSEPNVPDYDNIFKPEALKRVRGPVLTPGDPMSVAGKASSLTRKAFLRGTTGIPTTSNRIELDPWFQASGMAATYDATGGSESVSYTPADSGLLTITEYYYQDGVLYKYTGNRGDLSLMMDVGGAISIEFKVQGRVAADIDTATPTNGVFSSLAWPIATDAPVFSVDGFSAGIIRHWEHHLGNVVQIRNGIKSIGGIAGWRIDSRNPTFSVTLEEDLRTTKDWTQLRDNRTPLAIAWTANAAQYNTPDFAAARAFIRKVTPSTDNGLALVTLEGDLRGTTPFTLKIK